MPVQKNSVDQLGNCTQSFILDYKIITREFARLEAHAQAPDRLQQIEAVHDACDSFFSHHLATISCIFTNNQNETIFVESSVIKQECEKIQAML